MRASAFNRKNNTNRDLRPPDSSLHTLLSTPSTPSASCPPRQGVKRRFEPPGLLHGLIVVLRDTDLLGKQSTNFLYIVASIPAPINTSRAVHPLLPTRSHRVLQAPIHLPATSYTGAPSVFCAQARERTMSSGSQTRRRGRTPPRRERQNENAKSPEAGLWTKRRNCRTPWPSTRIRRTPHWMKCSPRVRFPKSKHVRNTHA